MTPRHFLILSLITIPVFGIVTGIFSGFHKIEPQQESQYQKEEIEEVTKPIDTQKIKKDFGIRRFCKMRTIEKSDEYIECLAKQNEANNIIDYYLKNLMSVDIKKNQEILQLYNLCVEKATIDTQLFITDWVKASSCYLNNVNKILTKDYL